MRQNLATLAPNFYARRVGAKYVWGHEVRMRLLGMGQTGLN